METHNTMILGHWASVAVYIRRGTHHTGLRFGDSNPVFLITHAYSLIVLCEPNLSGGNNVTANVRNNNRYIFGPSRTLTHGLTLKIVLVIKNLWNDFMQ